MKSEDLIHMTKARVLHVAAKYVLFVVGDVRDTVAVGESKVSANKQLYVKRWLVDRNMDKWKLEWNPKSNMLSVKPKHTNTC